jgi:hypothetical protein
MASQPLVLGFLRFAKTAATALNEMAGRTTTDNERGKCESFQ